MKKKKQTLLVSSSGTAAAFHLIQICKQEFSSFFKIIACDINPAHLIPASKYADIFYQVPKIIEPDFLPQMLHLYDSEQIDIIIPIIDDELYLLTKDHPELKNRNIRVIGISQEFAQILGNKKQLSDYFSQHGLPVPITYTKKRQLQNTSTYFKKPINGHGSINTSAISGKEASTIIYNPAFLIQELCSAPEITIEVFNHKNFITSVCRERLETKNGVCTKAKIWFDPTLDELAHQLCSLIEMPPAFCFQVMKNQHQQWVITDVNPRLGGGTSMSTAYGWSLVRALLASLIPGQHSPDQYLKISPEPKYVTRIYQDIVM